MNKSIIVSNSMQENDIRPDELHANHMQAYLRDVQQLQLKMKDFVFVSCPSCSKSDAPVAYEKYGCTFVQCNCCNTIYMNPRPTQEIMTSYYQNSENYQYWSKYIFPATESARKENLYKPWLKRIELAGGGTHLLEVGAGFGGFAEAALQSTLFKNVTVIEPTPSLAAVCRKRGLRVIEKRVEDVQREEIGIVDVLVSFEVIEHLFEPKNFFRQAYSLLAPGGLLVVSCPNGLGFDVMMLKELSSAIDTEHINIFNPHSLRMMLEAEKFVNIYIDTPGKLDAELVHKAVLSGEYILTDPFMKKVLIDEWETLGEAFQNFLVQTNMSSHMWAYAQKNAN